MNRYLKALPKAVIKKILADPVLIAAWVLAFVSMFFVHPDAGYSSYVDWRSLGILWGLMVVIQGFRDNTVFEKAGGFLLKKVRNGWQLAAVLVFLCFFAGMFITNDVALITFVPFSIMILKHSGREDLMIPVIVLQTVAANLGSMLTPVGNPQNLYLYGLTGMSFSEFVGTMLPYTLLSGALLVAAIAFLPGKRKEIEIHEHYEVMKQFGHKGQIVVYALLFAVAMCTVLRLVPWWIMALVILAAALSMDYNVVFHVDYGLLLTFIGFFIFTGNIGRIPQIRDALEAFTAGREFLTSVLASQVISNVPAALLLSGFAKDLNSLLTGVNVGGLGTLIASMASLISYKAYTNAFPQKKKNYFLMFTAVNVAFLAFLCIGRIIIS